MAKLNAAARRAIPSSDFALPGRHYPIEDSGHAKAALARGEANATPAEEATIRRKVHAKYPGMELAHPVEGRAHPLHKMAHR